MTQWLDKRIVLAMHADLIREFGGKDGVRDEDLLESVLKYPAHDQPLAALAAAYTFGIACKQPFDDGNKGTAFAAAYTFLRMNDLRLNAEEVEAVAIMQDLAAGAIDAAELAAWIAAHTERV